MNYSFVEKDVFVNIKKILTEMTNLPHPDSNDTRYHLVTVML